MTARKTTKKAGTSVRKKTGKATKAAPKKKAPARKAGAAKKASTPRASKASAGSKKKAAPKKAAAPDPKPAAPVAKPAPAPKPDAPRAATSSLNVNMGHIFGLRPKANTSFRPGDLVEARQRLKDESYETLIEAARAVAEKALELTHESGARRGHKKRR